jgi:hypothetical protein
METDFNIRPVIQPHFRYIRRFPDYNHMHIVSPPTTLHICSILTSPNFAVQLVAPLIRSSEVCDVYYLSIKGGLDIFRDFP